MNKNKTSNEQGAVSGTLASIVALGILSVVFGSVMIWALVNYYDQKNNVDEIVRAEVASAKQEQSEADEVKFAEREKEPNKSFIGPNDLGRVEFKYPKTWSAYVAKDGSAGTYEAYLHPDKVPTVSSRQQFALRVQVIDRQYEQVINTYESRVERGDLRSSTVSANGYNGIRLDGAITESIRGSLVVFKVRDKSLILQTDAESFRPDFTNIIVKSLVFNP